MGYVACKEGAALGMNWSFAPIVDIKKSSYQKIAALLYCAHFEQ